MLWQCPITDSVFRDYDIAKSSARFLGIFFFSVAFFISVPFSYLLSDTYEMAPNAASPQKPPSNSAASVIILSLELLGFRTCRKQKNRDTARVGKLSVVKLRTVAYKQHAYNFLIS